MSFIFCNLVVWIGLSGPININYMNELDMFLIPITLKEEIDNKQSILTEEQRCLNWCYENPEECDVDEIPTREEYVNNLADEIDNLIRKSEK